MPRIIFIIVLAAAAALPLSVAQAEEETAAPSQPKQQIAVPKGPKRVGPIGRGINGVKNIVLSPLEIPVTVMGEAQNRDNFIEAFLFGIGNGVGNFVVRGFAGVIELTTVPVPAKTMPLYDRRLGEPATLPEPWQ